MIYLGVRTLLRNEAPPGAPSANPVSLKRAYFEGVLVNVLNPKVALFFLAFLPQFVDPAHGTATAQILLLGLLFFAIALVIDLLYAVVAGSLGARLARTPRALRRRRQLTGSVYIVLGPAAALSPQTRARS